MRRLTLMVMLVAALLATVVATPASATYAGRDGRLAFVRANQIYTVNATGTGAAKRTSAGKNYRPHWSPDGRRIAYVHEPAAGVRELWVMRADGTGKSRVTRGGNATAGPSWSPDGRWLAFAGSGGMLAKIKATAPYGLPVPLLGYFTGCWCDGDTTPVPIPVDRFLAWSPDGSTIALYNHFDGSVDDTIYMYDVATGEARQHLGTGADCCGYADWSDLAWGAGGQFGYGEVDFGFEPGTTGVTTIRYPGFASVAGDRSPAPAPSGMFMALTSSVSGVAKVYVANADGSGRRVVANGYQPDWQPLP